MKGNKLLYIVLAGFFCLTGCRQNQNQTYIYNSGDVIGMIKNGRRLLENGSYKEALHSFHIAMLENPKDIEARLGAVDSLIGLGNYKQALEDISIAVAIVPDKQVLYEKALELSRLTGEKTYAWEAIEWAENYEQDWFLDGFVPPKPSADLMSGTYREKQEVSLSSAEGDIYYSLSWDEGKISDIKYRDTVSLPRGESVLTAYSVADGVPGEQEVWTYECEYPPIPVTFADPVVEQVVRTSLDKKHGEITDEDCKRLSEFDIYKLQNEMKQEEYEKLKIHSLEDMKWLINVNLIYITNQDQIEDWSPLFKMPNLRKLYIDRCGLTDLSFLKNIPALEGFSANYNEITDISFLKDMDHLNMINIANNPITNLSVIYDMKQLTYLFLSGTQNVDIEKISKMKQLSQLHIMDAKNLDFTKLIQLDRLTHLSLTNCGLTDISFIKDLKELVSIQLQDNQIADVSPLEGIDNLERINLKRNPINNMNALMNLKGIKELMLNGTQVPQEQVQRFKLLHPSCWLDIGT